MATSYISGGTRITGLGFDLDFDGILENMYTLECIPKNRFTIWKNDWQIRVNAFQELNTEMLALKRTMDSLSTVNQFLSKTATVSDDTVVSATSSPDTPEGIYNINVEQIATTATVTFEGRRFAAGAKINSSQTDGTFTYSYKGTQYSVNVPPDTKIEQFVSLLNNDQKNPGVVATLIKDGNGNQILQLRGKDLGANATLKIEGYSSNLNFGASATSNSTFTNGQVLNTADPSSPDSATLSFIFTYDGRNHTIDVAPGETINDLVNSINAQSNTTGVQARLSEGDHGQLILEETDSSKKLGITVSANTTVSSLTAFSNTASSSSQTSSGVFSSDSVLNPADSNSDLTFSITFADGTQKTFTLNPGDTMQDLLDDLNDPSTGVSAELDANGKLVITESDSSQQKGFTVSSSVSGLNTFMNADDWDVIDPTNAKYSINGWPKEGLESATNSLTEAVPGMTILLKDVGSTQISVNASIDGIKENIITFIDGYNTVMAKIQELTKIDENKEVVDTDDTNSLYDSQMGSVLTGNYGVQMIASKLKNALTQKGTGFEYAEFDLDGNLISGDRYSALSQIGIKTVTDEGDESFGLLTIDEAALEEALSTDMNAVVELFAAGGNGVTDSADFTYDSYLPGTTQSGAYTVSYDVEMEYVNKQMVDSSGAPMVDADGNPVYEQDVNDDGTLKVDDEGNPVYVQVATGKYIITNAYINGQPAKINQEDRLITATTSGDAAAGLAIMVNNMKPGSYSGEVRLKGGKASDLSAVLSQLNNSDTGTLPVLINNYKTIIERIDTKIDFENNRLALWQRTQRERFARLEATLSTYQAQLDSLESQLESLKSSSSS